MVEHVSFLGACVISAFFVIMQTCILMKHWRKWLKSFPNSLSALVRDCYLRSQQELIDSLNEKLKKADGIWQEKIDRIERAVIQIDCKASGFRPPVNPYKVLFPPDAPNFTSEMKEKKEKLDKNGELTVEDGLSRTTRGLAPPLTPKEEGTETLGFRGGLFPIKEEKSKAD